MAYATITKPGLHFNTKLYTGNGSNDHAITGVGFQPDWTWIKARSQSTYDHMVFDAVRGQYKVIRPNLTNAESTDTSGVKSFDTDGFTTNLGGYTNGNSVTFASWNWKANGQGSSNTDGSTNTTYTSANTTAGFSIVKWPGTGSNTTIGHGLGAVPKVIIVKALSGTQHWATYTEMLGNTKGLYLNATTVSSTETSWWNSTSPTSSVFTVGTSANANGSGKDYIAYCFAEKKGYSKFGSYTGNGNADGTFVYCGFKPAWVIIKPTTVAQNWQIHDTKRDGYNPKNDNLSSNNANAEADNKFIDIVSNGFKLRRSDVLNVNGDPYVYMAFAEEPLVANVGASIPATAR